LNCRFTFFPDVADDCCVACGELVDNDVNNLLTCEYCCRYIHESCYDYFKIDGAPLIGYRVHLITNKRCPINFKSPTHRLDTDSVGPGCDFLPPLRAYSTFRTPELHLARSDKLKFGPKPRLNCRFTFFPDVADDCCVACGELVDNDVNNLLTCEYCCRYIHESCYDYFKIDGAPLIGYRVHLITNKRCPINFKSPTHRLDTDSVGPGCDFLPPLRAYSTFRTPELHLARSDKLKFGPKPRLNCRFTFFPDVADDCCVACGELVDNDVNNLLTCEYCCRYIHESCYDYFKIDGAPFICDQVYTITNKRCPINFKIIIA
jgi:hypothetical protein